MTHFIREQIELATEEGQQRELMLRQLLNSPDIVAAARDYIILRSGDEFIRWIAAPILAQQAEDPPYENEATVPEPPPQPVTSPPTPLPPTTMQRRPELFQRRWGGAEPSRQSGVTRFLTPAGSPPEGAAPPTEVAPSIPPPAAPQAIPPSLEEGAAAVAREAVRLYLAQAHGVPPPTSVAPPPPAPAAPGVFGPPPGAASELLLRSVGRYFTQ